MNGMSVTKRSVDQGRNQKEVQISKGENVNPVISVDDSEGRFVLHFFDPATLKDGEAQGNVVFFPSLHPLLDTITILSFKRNFMRCRTSFVLLRSTIMALPRRLSTSLVLPTPPVQPALAGLAES